MRATARRKACWRSTMNDNTINDRQFWDELNRLKKLHEFVLREVGTNATPVSLSLGRLKSLTYSGHGREPLPDEWIQIETSRLELYRILTPAQLRKFAVSFAFSRSSILTIGGLYLLLLAMGALIIAGIIRDINSAFLAYLMWLLCLGGMGSIASIAMNVLSLQ